MLIASFKNLKIQQYTANFFNNIHILPILEKLFFIDHYLKKIYVKIMVTVVIFVSKYFRF